MRAVVLILAGIMLIFSGVSMAADGVTGIGSLDNTESRAAAVSADGSVVVGIYGPDLDLSAGSAYLWTLSGGMVDLGVLDGEVEAQATGVSADGSVVVGHSGARPFLWTKEDGMTDLGHLFGGGPITKANAVSADGKVVAGAGIPGIHWTDYYRAFRWTQNGGFESLGTLGGHMADSHATAVSADGRVVAGWAYTDGTRNYAHAFRWVQGATGGVAHNPQMFDLGTLGGSNSQAEGVSADGTVVVGGSENRQGRYRAFRWVQGATGGVDGNAQMFDLGTLGGLTSRASDVSADGTVIVGSSQIEPDDLWADNHAFRWTEETGMQSVMDWLSDAGVTVTGWKLEDATGTNEDGSVIVGNGIHPDGHEEAWIARVGQSGESDGGGNNGGESGDDGGNGGLITPGDLNKSLAATGGARISALTATQTLLGGLRGRPLEYRLPEGSGGIWAIGDWGRSGGNEERDDVYLTGIGIGRSLSAAQVNGFIGAAGAYQKTPFGGGLDVRGTYIMGEVMGPLTGNGRLWGVVTGYYMGGEARIRRAYPVNGGSIDQSQGTPSLSALGLRARLEWEARAFGVRPYVDLSHSRMQLAQYSEKGGAFPAHFDGQTEGATELRLGLGWARTVSPTMRLTGLVEGVHRFEKTVGSVSGQVIGLSDFHLSGKAYDRDWLRAGVGVEAQLPVGTVSVMLSAATRGETPNVLMTVSWGTTF